MTDVVQTSNGNNDPAAAGHAGWCLYRLDCERKAASPRECNCGTRPLAESLRQALKWDWPNTPRDALGNIQHALRLALEAHGNETGAYCSPLQAECAVLAGRFCISVASFHGWPDVALMAFKLACERLGALESNAQKA